MEGLPNEILPSDVEDEPDPNAPVAVDPDRAPTSTTATSSSSQSATQETTSPSATSEPAPASPSPLAPGVIAAIVIVIVLVLVAPVALYFFLTRHDRVRAKSQPAGSRVSSRAYPDMSLPPPSRAGVTSPAMRSRSSETDRLKASEIMNFDLGPTIEKPHPAANGNGSLDGGHSRPFRPQRPPRPLMVHDEAETSPPIGQALSRYSGTHDSLTIPEHLLHTNPSFQGLSDENVRIARYATDSQLRVSEISAPEDRTSRQVGGRALDEISDVSSLHDDDSATLAVTDHSGHTPRHAGGDGSLP